MKENITKLNACGLLFYTGIKARRSGQNCMPLNHLRLFTESVGKEFIYIGVKLMLSFSNFA